MIVDKEFIKKIKDFGLNSYEAKLWTALLSRGISTAGELSDIANVPRSRSYDVLESLERKGFIITKIGKPIKYIAIPPNEVIHKVKKKIKCDADKQIEIIKSIINKDIFQELSILYKQGITMVQPNELAGSLKNRENIYDHLEAMVKNATQSICMMSTSSALKNKSDIFSNSFKKAKKRGVDIKIITDSKLPKNIFDMAQIKHSTQLNGRFIIFDDKQVVFMLLHDKNVHPAYDTGIWINSEFFSKTFKNMFNIVWDNTK